MEKWLQDLKLEESVAQTVQTQFDSKVKALEDLKQTHKLEIDDLNLTHQENLKSVRAGVAKRLGKNMVEKSVYDDAITKLKKYENQDLLASASKEFDKLNIKKDFVEDVQAKVLETLDLSEAKTGEEKVKILIDATKIFLDANPKWVDNPPTLQPNTKFPQNQNQGQNPPQGQGQNPQGQDPNPEATKAQAQAQYNQAFDIETNSE